MNQAAATCFEGDCAACWWLGQLPTTSCSCLSPPPPRMMTSPRPTASVQHLAPRLYDAMSCPSVLYSLSTLAYGQS